MREGAVRLRRRFVPAVALLALAFAGYAGDAYAVDGTLTVTYVGCTGMRVSPNPLPAGSYNVLVYDDDNCKASFSLTGPGVNLTSDLDSTGMGIDHPAGPFGPYTFQAGATYTARDSNTSGSATFTTSAATGSSGSSSGSTGSSTGSSSSGGSSSTGSTGGTSSSSGTKTLGALVGAISPTGRATLTIGGATVKKLEAGSYKLTVADHSKKAGLIIQALGYHAMTESTVPFTGTKTTTLRVVPGKYFFQASGGPKTYFTVTS